MKKALFIALSLCIFTVSIHSAIGDWFKKTAKKTEKGFKDTTKKVKKETKKSVKKTKKTFEDPGKTAQDAGYAVLRKMGVDVPGITQDVRLVQTLLGSLSNKVDLLQRVLNAPESPKSKFSSLLNKIKDVQTKAKLAERAIGPSVLRNSISSPQGILALVTRATSESALTHIRNFANAYSALITEFDSVQIVPLLSEARTTILTMAGTFDAILRIRSNAGSLAELITAGPTVSSVVAISKSLHRIAGDLNTIIKAGGTRSLSAVQGELIAGVISNAAKIENLTRDIHNSITAISTNAAKLKSDLNGMMGEKAKLLSAATSIQGKLEKAVESKLAKGTKLKKVIGAFDVPDVALSELKKIIHGMRGNLDGVLRNLSNVIMTAADSIEAGINGIDAFKRNLNFDLVPPQGRRGFDALTGDVRGLSSNVDRLRRSLR